MREKDELVYVKGQIQQNGILVDFEGEDAIVDLEPENPLTGTMRVEGELVELSPR